MMPPYLSGMFAGTCPHSHVWQPLIFRSFLVVYVISTDGYKAIYTNDGTMAQWNILLLAICQVSFDHMVPFL